MFPGALESHWIPMNRDLWRVERYRDFLAARRELLAKAANAILDNLVSDIHKLASHEPIVSILDRVIEPALGGIADEEEERIVVDCNQ